jgi:apolipoprotein N-acyltransferase
MQILISLKHTIASLSGWPRRLLALALGALAVLALPPLHIVGALIPAFVGLAWLIDASRGRAEAPGKLGFLKRAPAAAFAVGWWFGMGFFIAGLYWMSYAFLVDAPQFAWLIPFAVPSLSAVAALYIGLTAWATFVVMPAGLARAAFLPAAWVGAEWLRGLLLTGFPWNLLGTVWTFSDTMIQGAALFGVYGLSLLTAMAATAPAVLTDERARLRTRWLLVAGAYLAIAALGVGGWLRLHDAATETVAGVRLRLIQPNIAQSNKWQPELRVEIMRLLIEMSAAPPSGAAPTHIIWPETATPEFLAEYPDDIRVLARFVPKGGALITGAPRIERGGAREVTVWNSVHVIDDEARIRATYDKFHLVPFGEYLPFPNWLGVRKLTAGRVDFTPGPGLATLEIPGAPPVSPLICYEGIFPAHVVAPGEPKPQWLLNVTNDAWFGISSGPYQHLATVRLRAVEEGLPLARAANNGVSGVFDAYGRTTAYGDLGDRAVIDADLPQRLAEGTVFASVGNWSVFLFLLIYISVFPLFSKGRFRATLRPLKNQ